VNRSFHLLFPGFLLGIGLAVEARAQGPNQARPPAPRAERPAVTVPATRITTPIDVDGRLDDEVYQVLKPVSGFIQQEPREGAPATEQTEVWVMFDARNLYVSARCWDSQPEREVATELRHDSSNIVSNENFAVAFDTFHDLRNAYQFQTNPLGGNRESAIVDSVASESWNTVWDVRSQRTDQGFTVEMSIPFKSLRYSGSGPQVWGINFRRIVKWKNEMSFLTPIPAAFGLAGFNRLEFAATLVGLETPSQSLNLEVKPFVVSSLTTDRAAATPFSNDGDASTGFDFKYGLTRSLVADVTVNTDFAQVEEDQQQVNLTRFSLFFPEKREFFLEGQGIFAFGGLSFGNTNQSNPGDVPVMFFSRRIGLNNGQSVPVVAGGRVTGRAGRYSLGAVHIQTDDKPEANAVSTNFTALRLKRDILRRSNIGVIATRRSPTASGLDDNLAFGADLNLFLTAAVTLNTYYARTDSPGRTDGEASYRGRFEYLTDRYGMTAEHLAIDPGFNPEVGFVRRTDFRRSYGQLRFSPRPGNSERVRKYSLVGSLDYVTDAEITSLQERELRGTFNIDYQNGDALNFDYTRNYELVPRNFVINPGTTVPAGGYSYQNLSAQYSLGVQRKVSGRISAAYGSLYEGTKSEAGYGGRIAIVPQFAIEPNVSLNWVRLPYGDFSAPVVSSRFIATPNARMAITSFLQYNGGSRTMSSSIRLRWEYRGGSELFVVYSDGRNTRTSGYPDLVNRSFAVKVTRLLRF
jgi:hypothetical protein